jgi:valyl-tRNA synthetase
MAPWPEMEEARIDAEAESHMDTVMAVIREIRAVRSEYHVQAGRRIAVTLAAGSMASVFEQRRPMVTFLARLDDEAYTVVRACDPLEQSASVTVGDVVAYLPLAGMVDLEAERTRLQKNLDELYARIEESKERLAGPFAEKAPDHIVQRERDKLASMQTEAEQVKEQMALLS